MAKLFTGLSCFWGAVEANVRWGWRSWLRAAFQWSLQRHARSSSLDEDTWLTDGDVTFSCADDLFEIFQWFVGGKRTTSKQKKRKSKHALPATQGQLQNLRLLLRKETHNVCGRALGLGPLGFTRRRRYCQEDEVHCLVSLRLRSCLFSENCSKAWWQHVSGSFTKKLPWQGLHFGKQHKDTPLHKGIVLTMQVGQYKFYKTLLSKLPCIWPNGPGASLAVKGEKEIWFSWMCVCGKPCWICFHRGNGEAELVSSFDSLDLMRAILAANRVPFLEVGPDLTESNRFKRNSRKAFRVVNIVQCRLRQVDAWLANSNRYKPSVDYTAFTLLAEWTLVTSLSQSLMDSGLEPPCKQARYSLQQMSFAFLVPDVL